MLDEPDLYLPIRSSTALPFDKYIVQIKEVLGACRNGDNMKVTILWPRKHFAKIIKLRTKEWDRHNLHFWMVIVPNTAVYDHVDDDGRLKSQFKTTYTGIELEPILDLAGLGQFILKEE